MSDILQEQTVYNNIVSSYLINLDYKSLYEFISDFYAVNSEALSTKDPGKYINYLPSDNTRLLKIFNISDENNNIIKSMLKEIPSVNQDWNLINNITNILLTSVIFYSFLNQKDKKFMSFKHPIFRWVSFMLTLKLYSSKQRKYFKHASDENVMKFTVDNLNKKWLLGKVESLTDIMLHYSETSIDYNTEDGGILLKPITKNIFDFIIKLDTRINNFMRNLSNIYYENYNNNKRSVVDEEMVTHDDGNSEITVQKSITNDIEIVSRKCIHTFITANTDYTILKVAVDKTRTSFNNMYALMETIREKENSESDSLISSIIKNMVSYHFVTRLKQKNDIKNWDFRNSMIHIYNISNTTNEYIINIRLNLNELLLKYHKGYSDGTINKTTKSNMRSCIYVYFIYFIMKYS